MNANPMEAKDTTHQTTYLKQLEEQTMIRNKPSDGRVVDVVHIDEKDRAELDATLALFHSCTALTPARLARNAAVTEAASAQRGNLRVYAYGRTSNNGIEGGSRVRQNSSQEQTAERWHLGPILGFYHDDDVSGADTDRPDWGALELELAAHWGSILIVEEVDRLFRTALSASYIIQFLINHGVKLYDAKGFVDEQRLMEEAAKATGAYFLLCKRSFDARRRAMRAGKFLTTAPWGYIKRSRGVIVPDRDLVKTVKRVFEMRAANKPVSTICHWLDEQGILTPSGTVGWCWKTMRDILSNFIYVGLTIYRVRPEEGEEYAPIVRPTMKTKMIENDLFAAVQATWNKTPRNRTNNGGGDNRSILTKKVSCWKCGGLLRQRHALVNEWILWCSTKHGGCGAVQAISKNTAEANVYRAIKSKILSDGAQSSYEKSLGAAQERRDADSSAARERLDEQIEEKQGHLDRARATAFRLELMETMREELKKADDELNTLRELRQELPSVHFVPRVSVDLMEIGNAMDIMIENVPYRCADTTASELVRLVGKVVTNVVLETTVEGRIRQHTFLNFNGLLRPGESSDANLLVTVVAEDEAPLLRFQDRNVVAVKAHMGGAGSKLSDAEFATLVALPEVKRHFKNLGTDTMRRGFDAVAAFITSEATLSDCLRACHLDPEKGFAKRLSAHRNDTGGADLVVCFHALRPHVPFAEKLLVSSIPVDRERAKFVGSKHPILAHPLLDASSGRARLDDEEWDLVLQRLKGRRLFKPKTQGRTRLLLDAYFRSIRESRSLRASGAIDNLRSAYKCIENMHQKGQFNEVCVVLLENAGLREPGSKVVLPRIGLKKIRTRRDVTPDLIVA